VWSPNGLAETSAIQIDGYFALSLPLIDFTQA
jgi:hypothetical protein